MAARSSSAPPSARPVHARALLNISIMQKALADDFPFDLARLMDGAAPNEKKMKNVFGFASNHWEWEDKLISGQQCHHLFVCLTISHSFDRRRAVVRFCSAHAHRHTHAHVLVFAAV